MSKDLSLWLIWVNNAVWAGVGVQIGWLLWG